MKGEGEALLRCPSPSSSILAATSTAAERTHDGVALPFCPLCLHQSHPGYTSAKQGAGVACCVPAFTYWETGSSVYIVLENSLDTAILRASAFSLTNWVM